VAKRPAGEIHTEVFKDRLRLRFTYNRRQYTLPLKLADTPVNRKVADNIASQISRDILLKIFDPSKLLCYRGDLIDTKQDTILTTAITCVFAHKIIYSQETSF
jgi:hypothetical protein